MSKTKGQKRRKKLRGRTRRFWETMGLKALLINPEWCRSVLGQNGMKPHDYLGGSHDPSNILRLLGISVGKVTAVRLIQGIRRVMKERAHENHDSGESRGSNTTP